MQAMVVRTCSWTGRVPDLRMLMSWTTSWSTYRASISSSQFSTKLNSAAAACVWILGKRQSTVTLRSSGITIPWNACWISGAKSFAICPRHCVAACLTRGWGSLRNFVTSLIGRALSSITSATWLRVINPARLIFQSDLLTQLLMAGKTTGLSFRPPMAIARRSIAMLAYSMLVFSSRPWSTLWSFFTQLGSSGTSSMRAMLRKTDCSRKGWHFRASASSPSATVTRISRQALRSPGSSSLCLPIFPTRAASWLIAGLKYLAFSVAMSTITWIVLCSASSSFCSNAAFTVWSIGAR
mmetsp:Transcript_15318/g.37583  ORF Transcript_15318/g.37583 Transcript_15318/m.37583 type:complete len:296 (+) Transcript_15318:1911-2798(+)